ncbi:MAG: hypothetical protein H0W85_02785 [Methylotenera sp.]|nr:hypothetical protein [Methylotenera sp.]
MTTIDQTNLFDRQFPLVNYLLVLLGALFDLLEELFDEEDFLAGLLGASEEELLVDCAFIIYS